VEVIRSGLKIQSLMIMAVEGRFGVLHTGREIEFLSDRGSIYRSYAVQLLARRIRFKILFYEGL